MNALGQVLHDYDYYYYKNSNKLRGVLPIVRDTTYSAAINSNNKLYRDILVERPARPQIGAHTELRATQNVMIDTVAVGSEFEVVKAMILQCVFLKMVRLSMMPLVI